MAKVFNVDELVKDPKEVIIKGNTYQVREMSVADFVATMRAAEQLEKLENDVKEGKDISKVEILAAQMEVFVAEVLRAVPDAPEVDVRGLPMNHLTALSQFIRGEIPAELKAQVEADLLAEKQTESADGGTDPKN